MTSDQPLTDDEVWAKFMVSGAVYGVRWLDTAFSDWTSRQIQSAGKPDALHTQCPGYCSADFPQPWRAPPAMQAES